MKYEELQQKYKELKLKNQALKLDLEFTKEHLNCTNRRLDNYKEYLLIATSLLTKKQHKKYTEQFLKTKEKQNQKTINAMENMVNKFFNL